MPIVLFIHADAIQERVRIAEKDIAPVGAPRYVTKDGVTYRAHHHANFCFQEDKTKFVGYVYMFPRSGDDDAIMSYSSVCSFDSFMRLKLRADTRLIEHNPVRSSAGRFFFVLRDTDPEIFRVWCPHNEAEARCEQLVFCASELTLPSPFEDTLGAVARVDLERHLRHIEETMS